MNAIDRMVSWFSPVAGLRRQTARRVLDSYEAAEPSRQRKFYHRRGNQNETVQRQGKALLTQIRHLISNHDLARGALRTIVNNVAGPAGIGIEPQPRMANGDIHKQYALDLLEAYRDWCLKPEVTHQYTMSQLQRGLVMSKIRDGEVFARFVEGTRPDLNHGTRVPLSLEVFETDMVPYENNESQRIAQGIERNAWGQPTALHVYKSEPWRVSPRIGADTKPIPWELVMHMACKEYISQMRGVSEFAAVITRLEDIKDYEESERVAAKIAAMLTAYIRKGTPQEYDVTKDKDRPREINFEPAMIIDDLLPGEEIDLIDAKRPNPNVVTFRQGQLRAVAAGVGASYSSVSRDYNGTYSAQRQELVEQWVHYAVLVDDFVGEFVQPTWQRFVMMADLSGVVRRPGDVVPGSAADALFVGQSMPWIDPLKEALGSEALVNAGFASTPEIIRRRGGNPHTVLAQQAAWQKEAAENDLVFTTNESSLEAARLAESGSAEQ